MSSAETRGQATEGERTLADAAPNVTVIVVRLDLEATEAAWLTAVGIGDGEELTILRRAPFGGPLHVATSLGGELAIGAPLARGIVVRAST